MCRRLMSYAVGFILNDTERWMTRTVGFDMNPSNRKKDDKAAYTTICDKKITDLLTSTHAVGWTTVAHSRQTGRETDVCSIQHRNSRECVK